MKPLALLVVALAASALSSCGERGDADRRVLEARNSAAIALARAQSGADLGSPIDVAALKATPGMDAAVRDWAENARLAVAMKLSNPTGATWGPTWTVDYTRLCGTVGGTASPTAAATRFVSVGDAVVMLETDPEFSEGLWAACNGARIVLLPATEAASPTQPNGQ